MESVKGMRVRTGGYTSQDRPLSFLAGTARPLATTRSTPASSSPVNARGASHFRLPSAAYGGDSPPEARSQPAGRPGAAGPQKHRNNRELYARGLRATPHGHGKPSIGFVALCFPMSQVRPKEERVAMLSMPKELAERRIALAGYQRMKFAEARFSRRHL